MLFFFKQKTAYEMRISDWSSDVCSSDLGACQDVGMEHAPDARAFHVVMIDPPGQPGVAAAQLAQYFRLCRMQQAFDRSCPQGRSDERRVGQEGVSTLSSRWSALP